ncbi:MAG: hypothetical protein JXA07_03705 [Spirochaetes bacterium]|nr:hypothetical protein [Spirochaetota bacterium]
MKLKICGKIAVIFSMVIIFFCLADPLDAKNEENIKLQDTDSASVIEKIKPELGAKGSFIIPFGKPAPYLGYGYGAALYFDLTPFKQGIFTLRMGISSEFMYFNHKTSAVSARLMIFPEYAHIRLAIRLENGFLAYLKLGGGIGIALLNKTEYQITKIDKIAFDPLIAAGLGIGYNPPKVKNLVVFVEGDYKMIFESVSGQFVSASLGVGYQF